MKRDSIPSKVVSMLAALVLVATLVPGGALALAEEDTGGSGIASTASDQGDLPSASGSAENQSGEVAAGDAEPASEAEERGVAVADPPSEGDEVVAPESAPQNEDGSFEEDSGESVGAAVFPGAEGSDSEPELRGQVLLEAAESIDATAFFHATISTDQDTYTSGETARFSVQYTIDRGQVHEDDYIEVTVPESIASAVRLSVSPQHFKQVVDLGGGRYRLVFGPGAESALSGSFNMFVTTQADEETTDTVQVGDAGKAITVLPGGSPGGGVGTYTDTIMKDAADNGSDVWYEGYDYSNGMENYAQVGGFDSSVPHTLKYRLFINDKQAAISGVTVVDTLPGGMSFSSSHAIEVVDRDTGEAIDPSEYTVGTSGVTLTFSHPGEFSNTIQINYWVDVPASDAAPKYTNQATVTYTQDGAVYQESRNYVLQGTGYSAANGEKSVDKTQVSLAESDQWVEYTLKFWNQNGFAVGEINLTDQLDPNVRFLYAEENEYFDIVQDAEDPHKLSITNKKAFGGDHTEYVRFVCDFSDVPAGYVVANSTGGNTVTTTKNAMLALEASKTVDGAAPGDATFTFELLDDQGRVLQTVQNDVSGAVVFEPLEYTQDDVGKTFSYTVRERSAEGYDCDTSQYAVTAKPVLAMDDPEAPAGRIAVETAITKDGSPAESISFENKSALPAPTTHALEVEKELVGREWAEGDEFSFALRAVTEGAPMPSPGGEVAVATMDAQTAQFGPIEYSQAGSWEYQIVETTPSGNGITCDNAPHAVTVSVSEEDGALVARASYEGSTSLAVTNTYRASGQLVLEASKTVDGAAPGDATFTFELEGEGIEQTVANDGGLVKFAPIEYSESDLGKTFRYRVFESDSGDFDGDDVVYEVVAIPSDADGDGLIEPNATVFRDGQPVELMTFENTTPRVSIPVAKIWEDGENADGQRPDSITLNLTANGEVVEGATLTLSEACQWKGSFDDLPKIGPDGKEIFYSVREGDVDFYTATVEGSAEEGFTITNTRLPETPGTPHVEATKAADRSEVKPGDSISFTITVENVSDHDAEGVYVKDFVPEDTVFQSVAPAYGGKYGCTAAGDEYVTWFIDSLGAHESVSLEMTVRVKECTSGSVIENTAYHEVRGTPARPSDRDTPEEPTNTVKIEVLVDREPLTPVNKLPKTGDDVIPVGVLICLSSLSLITMALARKIRGDN